MLFNIVGCDIGLQLALASLYAIKALRRTLSVMRHLVIYRAEIPNLCFSGRAALGMLPKGARACEAYFARETDQNESVTVGNGYWNTQLSFLC
jgi:hypothetical protein